MMLKQNNVHVRVHDAAGRIVETRETHNALTDAGRTWWRDRLFNRGSGAAAAEPVTQGLTAAEMQLGRNRVFTGDAATIFTPTPANRSKTGAAAAFAWEVTGLARTVDSIQFIVRGTGSGRKTTIVAVATFDPIVLTSSKRLSVDWDVQMSGHPGNILTYPNDANALGLAAKDSLGSSLPTYKLWEDNSDALLGAALMNVVYDATATGLQDVRTGQRLQVYYPHEKSTLIGDSHDLIRFMDVSNMVIAKAGDFGISYQATFTGRSGLQGPGGESKAYFMLELGSAPRVKLAAGRIDRGYPNQGQNATEVLATFTVSD